MSVCDLMMNSEPCADAQVLLKSLEGMMELVETQACCYNDVRKRLVEAHLSQPNLSVDQIDAFFIDGQVPGFNMAVLRQKLGTLAGRLRQVTSERANAQRQTEAAIQHLNDENQYLREELMKLRRESFSSPKV